MEQNSCVSIYPGGSCLAKALHSLQAAGSDLQQVSVLGKGSQAQALPIGFCLTGRQARFWGPASATWAQVWQLLPDAACFWVPGSGALAAAGQIVSLMIHGESEAAAGLSVPGKALYGLGIPRHSIEEYEQAIHAEHYLLLVGGHRHEVEQACDLLHDEAQQVTVHSA
ncbi:MAG TPA: DUF1269 domain-containing protein [Gammaproteobacteria bacterium]|nr:DUF1269 domain-containing protein [Gammaproteobacteria bacterium]